MPPLHECVVFLYTVLFWQVHGRFRTLIQYSSSGELLRLPLSPDDQRGCAMRGWPCSQEAMSTYNARMETLTGWEWSCAGVGRLQALGESSTENPRRIRKWCQGLDCSALVPQTCKHPSSGNVIYMCAHSLYLS